MESGANLNVTDSRALVLVAESEHVHYLDLLIKSGVDVKTSAGDTALRKAALLGHDACVDLLIKSGADVNSADSYGNTALISAAKKGYDRCVDLLIRSGANVNVTKSEGQTALMYASQWGHDKCMDLLIKSGADVNITDSKGETALISAVRCIEHIKPDCVDILLTAGADVNAGITTPSMGITLLHQAASKRDELLVRKLLQANSKINVIDGNGYNALTRHIMGSAHIRSHLLGHLLHTIRGWGEAHPRDKQGGDFPGFLLQKNIKLNLKHICRETIRNHLLDSDPHSNLFRRLGLPSRLTEYLLFKLSLDDYETDVESLDPMLSMIQDLWRC